MIPRENAGSLFLLVHAVAFRYLDCRTYPCHNAENQKKDAGLAQRSP